MCTYLKFSNWHSRYQWGCRKVRIIAMLADCIVGSKCLLPYSTYSIYRVPGYALFWGRSIFLILFWWAWPCDLLWPMVCGNWPALYVGSTKRYHALVPLLFSQMPQHRQAELMLYPGFQKKRIHKDKSQDRSTVHEYCEQEISLGCWIHWHLKC